MNASRRPTVVLSWLLPLALILAGTPVVSQAPGDPIEMPRLPQAERIQLVADILEAADDAERDIKSAARFVRSVTEQLTGVKDLVLAAADDPGHALPSQAVEALFARVGDPNGADPEELAKLDALPELLRLALMDVFNAYIAFDAAAQALPAAAPVAGTWDPITIQVLAARNTLLDAVATFEEAHRATRDEMTLDEPILLPPVFGYEPVGVDSRYDDDYLLLIDVGGNDRYYNNAGGSGMRPISDVNTGGVKTGWSNADRFNWNVDPCVISEPVKNRIGFHGAAALIDLGGNDRYGMGGACGVNGGGNAGAGFLFDQSGRDYYMAGHSERCQMFHLSGKEYGSCGANGGGYRGGVGFLLDMDGRDDYTGTNGGVNGGGYVGGVGFLFDINGIDTYKATSAGVNGGAHSTGFGFLYDGVGNDYFEGTSAGVNGGGDGGRGHLIDRWGHDTYIGTHQGVNGGATAGLANVIRPLLGFRNSDVLSGQGLLYDVWGNDIYIAELRGVNGAGEMPFGGLGLLVDENGVDTYYDRIGGAGIDVNMVPKGTGAQIDRESGEQPIV